MSIHEIYENVNDADKMMDIVDDNCIHCGRRCRNLDCPNMKALMNCGEKTDMTKEQKKRYFNLVGG